MKKLLPVIIALVGLIGGVTAGTVFKPSPAADEHAASDEHASSSDDGHGSDHGSSHASDDGHGSKTPADEYIYVGLEKPFFAPVERGNGSRALVRIDIHLEVPPKMEEAAVKHDPKLRDAFLRAVLDFSEKGGFSRVHAGEGFDVLRDNLLVGARGVLGPKVKSVLIGEILTRDG